MNLEETDLMKRCSKFISFIMVVMIVMVAFCTVSFAATVGTQLASPEDGWQRIDDTNSKILYDGTWSIYTNSGFWGGTDKYSLVTDSTIKFKFYGTKLRIIGQYHSTASKNTRITIDGVVYNYSEYSSTIGTSAGVKYLVYEKTGLEQNVHSVVITVTNTDTTRFDAIDIDDTGYLIDINQPVLTSATPGDEMVTLKWNIIEGATGYNVKRSLAAGGPYDIIKTLSGVNEYPDSGLNNGTTYYYVVSAIVSGTESSNSNEVSATPTAIGNSGILELTMTNGQVKEYELTATELDAFLTWYDGRSGGTGKAYYVFVKKSNIAPFLSRKEYISFDKISSFEVKEYAE
jgi:hypothetical protein